MLSKEEIERIKINLKTYTIEKLEDMTNIADYIDELESDNYELNNRINDYIEERQKLIEKLEENVEELEILHDNYIDANIVEGTYETLGRISKAKEILSLLKGEKE